MISSMTGYGKVALNHCGLTVTAEIRALNGKQFDLKMRMPERHSGNQAALGKYLSQAFIRGRIDVLVTIKNIEGPSVHAIDRDAFHKYYRQISSLVKEAGIPAPSDYLNILLRIPGVLQPGEDNPPEEEWRLVMRAAEGAAKQVNTFRKQEGRALEKDMRKRIRRLLSCLKQIKLADSERILSIRARITQKLSELENQVKIDNNRLEQEMIYYLDKLDISEEISRTEIHAKNFLETVKEDEPNGKKLGFIAQELLREINTLGNKSNDAGMQKLVVQMKDELEKIREQLGNVL